ncbi:MAG: outer membrane protein transport protein [Verrucomicrobiota bacterium JB023]|nr:outer membrane protein transport protein [Verrucomicrobiota bacterium JB023]
MRIGLALAIALSPNLSLAEGVLRPYTGAQSAGSAGARAGTSHDPLANPLTNPAALTLGTGTEWVVSSTTVIGDATFERAGQSYHLNDGWGIIPEAGITGRFGETPVWWGLSISAISALRSDWGYPDVAGGIGGINYGETGNESQFLALAGTFSAALRVNEQLSIGASLSAVYSEVGFDAPFIFQTNPALANAKVDLDMETDGWAPAVVLGVLWQPTSALSFGASVRPEIVLENEGSAKADFSAQLPPLGLAGTDPLASYHAESRNVLPLEVGAGVTWQATEKLSLSSWLAWTRWSEAYDVFEVNLSKGSNEAINGAIGDSPSDGVPLRWKDRFTLSIGAEYQLAEEWAIRAGWQWSESPIPEDLVTPLNAAILDQSLGLGASWQGQSGWSVDLAYNYDFSTEAHITNSGYNAGEYSNSSVDLSAHSVSVSLGQRF